MIAYLPTWSAHAQAIRRDEEETDSRIWFLVRTRKQKVVCIESGTI